MKPVRNNSLRLAVGASILLAMSAPLTAHAADEISYYNSYINKAEGVQMYSASQMDGDQYVSAIIYAQPDGTFAKLQEPYEYFWKDNDGSLLLTGRDDPEQSYVYDPASQSILRKTAYTVSPDGKWGYLERSRYEWRPGNAAGSGYTAKINDYYLKNLTTGATSIYYSTENRYGAFWINQHTLLENGFNETAKQNVISMYEPSTGKRQELLKGTLRNWNISRGMLYYEKNEPQRLPWVYDFKTGGSRLITDYAELEKLFPAALSSKPEITLPEGTVIKDLPVVEVPVTLTYEYNVNLNGQSIDVSTVFTKDGTVWIPAKPLAAALGWSIEAQERNSPAEKSTGYRFLISSGSTQLTLTPANSFISGSRLYVTQAQLKQLGYGNIGLTPLPQ